MTREELIENLLDVVCMQSELLHCEVEVREGETEQQAHVRRFVETAALADHVMECAAAMGYQIYLEVGDEEISSPLSADSHKH